MDGWTPLPALRRGLRLRGRPSGTDPCWCAAVPLDTARDGLAARFAGCLCRACLTAAAGLRLAARGAAATSAAPDAGAGVTVRPRGQEER